MTKESEKMLEQNRITTTGRIKKGSIKIPIQQKHGNGTC